MLGTTGNVNAAGVEQTSEMVAAYEVIYSRYVTTTVETSERGVAEVVQIPIDGAGAKLKVYVDPQAPPSARVARAGVPGAVIGAQGGWRTVGQNGRSTANIPMLDYTTQILPLFNNGELEPLVTYENVPFPNADSKTVKSYTVTGWEESNNESQDMIYPAYRLDAEYSETIDKGGGITETVVHTGFTWIAAHPAFMRPFARIDQKPADKSYKSGDTVSAMAADASQTLAALGFDSALNFEMGEATTYLYNWYLGDAQTGKKIGETRTLSYELTAADLAEVKDSLLITLQVVNSETAHTSVSTSTTNHQLKVVPPVYLPTLIR